ncbi:MAG: hypothetical protein ONB27_12125 [candidate division KSB1 bacterium]|nr:hypothetical protein [candidate division KSB1 bacterium]
MWKIILLIILAIAIAIIFALVYGDIRWKSATKDMHHRLEAARISPPGQIYQIDELVGLPSPVQKYFRTVLQDGQPIVAAVTIAHKGTFNMSETGDNWKPFTSIQRVITQRPGFDWEARIHMAPGLVARVHDAYIAGEGILHGSLFGLISIVKMMGTKEVAEGELMRFFAETAWYPTALLPSQGVQWQAVSDSSARATLQDGDIVMTMLFRFNDDGLIESVYAEARGRTTGGSVIPTPWEGRWSNYEVRQGMLVPMQGEVAWVLPEGRKPYWRGRITSIQYEFLK